MCVAVTTAMLLFSIGRIYPISTACTFRYLPVLYVDDISIYLRLRWGIYRTELITASPSLCTGCHTHHTYTYTHHLYLQPYPPAPALHPHPAHLHGGRRKVSSPLSGGSACDPLEVLTFLPSTAHLMRLLACTLHFSLPLSCFYKKKKKKQRKSGRASGAIGGASLHTLPHALLPAHFCAFSLPTFCVCGGVIDTWFWRGMHGREEAAGALRVATFLSGGESRR